MTARLRIVLALGLLLFGTVFLFYSGPDYSAARSIKELWNLGHIGYFALLIWLLGHIPAIRRAPRWRQWSGLLLLSFVLGVGIEILQYGASRDPDMGDVSRDMAGALLMLAFYPSLSNFRQRRHRLALRSLALLVLVIHLAPISIALLDEAIARHQFPLLSNFETPFEIDRWNGNAHLSVADLPDGSRALRIELGTTPYSGAGMAYLPVDWRGYETLSLLFYNPDQRALGITLRVHDRQHEQGAQAYAMQDRFNRRFVLKPGWNKINVALAQIRHAPRGRLMDLSQIRNVSFFATRLPYPRELYLERIYLE